MPRPHDHQCGVLEEELGPGRPDGVSCGLVIPGRMLAPTGLHDGVRKIELVRVGRVLADQNSHALGELPHRGRPDVEGACAGASGLQAVPGGGVWLRVVQRAWSNKSAARRSPPPSGNETARMQSSVLRRSAGDSHDGFAPGLADRDAHRTSVRRSDRRGAQHPPP